MKILIASDIHGSYYYCQKLIERFHDEGADRIFLLGDILYHGPRNDLPCKYDPKKVIDILNSNSEKITSVRGNCDSEVDQMVLSFPIMSEYSYFILEGKMFYLTHGHHLDSFLPLIKEKDAYLIYGHTHVPCVETKNNVTMINPGSVSIPKENSRHSYIILENGKIEWKDIENGELYKDYYIR